MPDLIRSSASKWQEILSIHSVSLCLLYMQLSRNVFWWPSDKCMLQVSYRTGEQTHLWLISMVLNMYGNHTWVWY